MANKNNRLIVENYITWRMNPDNDAADDAKFASDQSISKSSLEKILTESDIDYESRIITERRDTYKKRMLDVDDAMFNKAMEGSVSAAELLYKRWDGWNPKSVEINDNRTYTFLDIIKKMDDKRLTGMLGRSKTRLSNLPKKDSGEPK